MDGGEAVDRISAAADRDQTPVIALSGFDNRAHAAAGRNDDHDKEDD